MMNNDDFFFLGKKLLNAKFVFAKSMPKTPHYYTLRETWNDSDFDKVVSLIRINGYKKKFFRTFYTYFDINNFQYWTMGASINRTILINKANKIFNSSYDVIANKYDNLYLSQKCLDQNEYVFNFLNIKPEDKVLDIGCGTGLFLDYVKIKPENYYGIDPSTEMLLRLSVKHKDYKTYNTKFENFYTDTKFDYIISLFGSCSYIEENSLYRINKFLKKNGKYFLMFYNDNYQPQYYGNEIKNFNNKTQEIELENSRKYIFDDYKIITNV